MIPDGDGFLRIFHTEREILHFLVSEEIGSTACSDDQFIIRKNAVFANDFILGRNDFFDVRHPELDVFRTLENLAEGKRNVGRLDAACCHLIEKRLEHVVIHPVDDHHLVSGIVIKMARELKSGKSSSDDDDFFPHCKCFYKFKFICSL